MVTAEKRPEGTCGSCNKGEEAVYADKEGGQLMCRDCAAECALDWMVESEQFVPAGDYVREDEPV